jgi:NIMA (never in mitosis gene a)-related kinase 1/4/5
MNTGEHISYEEEFEEMRCIGRGNFGAAFVVKLKNAPDGEEIYFIAKKIILNQLTDKEQEGAHLEVSFIFVKTLF